MKVYVIRHGESENNQNRLWTGWMDTPLTEKGRQDALQAGVYLSGITFDKVYTSDLSRARLTAQLAAPYYEHEASPLLREIHVGDLAGKHADAILDENGQRMDTDGYARFGGESLEALEMRVAAFLQRLQDSDYENIALFTHAGWLRRALNLVLGVKLPTSNVLCANCTIAVFEYDGSHWKLHSWINPKD